MFIWGARIRAREPRNYWINREYPDISLLLLAPNCKADIINFLPEIKNELSFNYKNIKNQKEKEEQSANPNKLAIGTKPDSAQQQQIVY